MEPVLIALLSGSGTMAVGLLWKVIHTWRFGESENEAVATKNAKIAVEAVSDVLDDLRIERVEQRRHIGELEGRLRTSVARIAELERSVAAMQSKLDLLNRKR